MRGASGGVHSQGKEVEGGRPPRRSQPPLPGNLGPLDCDFETPLPIPGLDPILTLHLPPGGC